MSLNGTSAISCLKNFVSFHFTYIIDSFLKYIYIYIFLLLFIIIFVYSVLQSHSTSQFGDVSLVIRHGRLISEGGRLVLVLRDMVLARYGNGLV